MYERTLIVTNLSSRCTLPLCSRTSHTQATCSWVKPKVAMPEAGLGVGGPPSTPPPSDAATPPTPGKLEKLERLWPTPEKAKNMIVLMSSASLEHIIFDYLI